MGNIYIGTSGYNYKDWRERFYPQGLVQSKWIAYFSEHFNTVEINATFYGHFKKQVFEKWAAQTPPEFKFVIKGPRFITHIKRLVGAEESVDKFFGSAKGLGEKSAIVLWQFPRSFKNTEENMQRLSDFFTLLPRYIRHAIELRDESWFKGKIFTFLKKHEVGFVINDTRAFPVYETVTADFVYIRFHGPSGLYSSSYSETQLLKWSKKIKKYLKTHDVYCYFNNDVSGYAIQNAKTLQRLIDGSS